MLSPLTIAGCVGLLLASWLLQQWSIRRRKYSRLPPGPPPSLLWGNKIAQVYSWRQFYEISKQYGPLMTLWSGTHPLVVCSSVEKYVFGLGRGATLRRLLIA